jgi:hypothetical protein
MSPSLPPGRKSFRSMIAWVLLSLGVSLGLPGVGAGDLFAQVQPLGPNQVAVGKPYRIAFDQPNAANITYWKMYHQTGTAKPVQVGPNILLAQLVNGGVTVELPMVAAPTKVALFVAAVNDPEPGVVTPMEKLSDAFPLEFLKPTATEPDKPINIRKARFDATFGPTGQITGLTFTVLETYE